ncbi:MAG: guanylate kinase [Candidatus Protochlamydia sp.]|nr:guanylate kinase [Candidatus Protochlamydia sp.]
MLNKKGGPLLGTHEKGLVFILSAPAGTGKTTLVDMLVKEFPTVLANVSYTTRAPREGEIEGVHYHFVSEPEFARKQAAGEFLESVKLYNVSYGSSRQWVEERINQGYHVFLVIDTQGAMQLKNSINAVYVFIRPPSLEALKHRLIKRQTETTEMVEKRLAWAAQELEAAQHYDYQITNDDLAIAYQVLKSILIAECHRS